ncbi:hypothetical protein OMAG_002623 [Candidatus Omnitrophus magneticus]|uniref:Uncharacterized protein n=1 Tax=Candidatus Omnitrophus magneticus TaxID=1609969 RepID=A0A0F0CQ08_9BACT|nr:hypothetical protein OMAG_002623 [Candidatus Omnitrophus magneticus]
MHCYACNFNSVFICVFYGVRAFKGRQKRRMDIKNFIFISLYKFPTQYTHISGKYY